MLLRLEEKDARSQDELFSNFGQKRDTFLWLWEVDFYGEEEGIIDGRTFDFFSSSSICVNAHASA